MVSNRIVKKIQRKSTDVAVKMKKKITKITHMKSLLSSSFLPSPPQITEKQQSRSEVFISNLVSKLGTVFSTPEEGLIFQGEDSYEMFFIIQGDCAVNIKEHDLQEHTAVRLLVEGDHFGEIGLIYKCPRTASIISRNYSTLAAISYYGLREVCIEMPEFWQHLVDYSTRYKWKTRTFLFQIIEKVEYL